MKKLVIMGLSVLVFGTNLAIVAADGTETENVDMTPSLAIDEYPGGGHWKYGVGTTGSYSDYRHPSKWHSATVTNKPSGRRSSETQGPGKWAKSRLNIYSGCEFFYNYWD